MTRVLEICVTYSVNFDDGFEIVFGEIEFTEGHLGLGTAEKGFFIFGVQLNSTASGRDSLIIRPNFWVNEGEIQISREFERREMACDCLVLIISFLK